MFGFPVTSDALTARLCAKAMAWGIGFNLRNINPRRLVWFGVFIWVFTVIVSCRGRGSWWVLAWWA